MNFSSFSFLSFGSFTLALAGVGFGQGGWTTETPIGLARGYLGVAAHEGFIYAVGGAHSGGIRTDRVERFDPQTHVWTQLAPLPVTRSEFGLAVLNGQLIAAGGEDSGGATGRVDIYDIATNTWTPAPALNQGRYDPAIAVVNGRVYTFGGGVGNSTVSTVEVYIPGATPSTPGRWEYRAPMPTARQNSVAAVVDGQIYVIGGAGSVPGTAKALSKVERYDPGTNTWFTTTVVGAQPLAQMPTPRYWLAGSTIAGQIYVAGGATNSYGSGSPDNPIVDVLEIFDPQSNQWQTNPPPSGLARYNLAAAALGNALYCIGGTNSLGQSVANTLVYRPDSGPTANAGGDFSVNEGQLVILAAGLSSDPDGDSLTYSWTQVTGGTAVTLSGATSVQASFTAPLVVVGGETLSFELIVTANGKSSTDVVSVSVVNVNHPPVADAGPDQSVAEGAPVTLQGGNSFDIDTDPFTYAWTQVDGNPSVLLAGSNTASPSFNAPVVGGGGAPGVVATLTFELRVDDGFPFDAPAPGYAYSDVVDRVTVEITNVNNPPVANAGTDITADENSEVGLTGQASSDPDGDSLTFSWVQISGPTVVLQNPAMALPRFTAPFVPPGGAELEFTLTVDDGFGGSAADHVVVHVQNANDPPLADAAQPSVSVLWPPNHRLVSVSITGVSDPDNNATITITGVTQDEPTNGLGDGDTAVDAVINPDGTVLLRAERSGNGNGRVYRVSFTASDPEGSSPGTILVKVPHNAKKPAIDSGGVYNSTQ